MCEGKSFLIVQCDNQNFLTSAAPSIQDTKVVYGPMVYAFVTQNEY